MSFDQHNVIKVILVLTGPTWVQLYYNWTQVGPVVGLALNKYYESRLFTSDRFNGYAYK